MVTPGVERFGSGDVVELLAGVVVRRRGADGRVGDWHGLGGQPGSDHAGSMRVVVHVGSDDVCPSVPDRSLYKFCCGVAHHFMKSNLASMRLSQTISLSLRLESPKVFSPFITHQTMASGCCSLQPGTRVDPPIRRLLLCSSPPWPSNPPANHHRHPSLPDTRLEIRQRGFHIDSRHLLAKQMIQFKTRTDPWPTTVHSRNQICAAIRSDGVTQLICPFRR